MPENDQQLLAELSKKAGLEREDSIPYVLSYLLNQNISQENKINKINILLTSFTQTISSLNLKQPRFYTDNTVNHSFVVPNNVNFIKFELTGAGGAGGIGYVFNNQYYSGGGGGAGQSIKRIYHVLVGDIITVKLGQGGRSNLNINN